MTFGRAREGMSGYLFAVRGILIVLLLSGSLAVAQEVDSSRQDKKKLQDSRLAKEAIHAVSRNPASVFDTTYNLKSEEVYKPYEGKIVRRILIERIGFDRTVQDTSHSVRTTAARWGNRLHTDTKVNIVRQHLFIQENKPLDPYRLADNERYLRDRDFILDSRIFVKPIPGSDDSVDLHVITRDVFSIGGTFSPSSATKFKIGVYDVNVAGWGQRLGGTLLFDAGRDPVAGTDGLYRKSSLAGSFADVSLQYSTINTGLSLGEENEKAVRWLVARNLFSPNARWAGGLEVSRNLSQNFYEEPDSTFLQYAYNYSDVWLGYNFGMGRRKKDGSSYRDRKFVALRYGSKLMTEQPDLEQTLNPHLYRTTSGVLGSFTFYRQNYYKTRYLFGFGRTEDVPYGYRLEFTAGHVLEDSLTRPYYAAEWSRTWANRKGDILLFSFRSSTFIDGSEAQDISALVALGAITRLYESAHVKTRHYFAASFTGLFEDLAAPPLEVNNKYGLTGFSADSLQGDKRVNLAWESIFYTKWTLLGFHFAPLAFAQAIWFNDVKTPGKTDFYMSLGGGVRFRNENLIFNTVEAKFYYYPIVTEDVDHFRFTFKTNLNLKYSGSFVGKPTLLLYNQ